MLALNETTYAAVEMVLNAPNSVYFTAMRQGSLSALLTQTVRHTTKKQGHRSIYDASLQAHIENRRQNPNARVILPKRYDSFEDYITVQKGKAQCEDQDS